MSAYGEEISDSEKVKIVSDFITNTPPGEFNEVFNDVRVIVNNDKLMREGCGPAFAKYNKDAFIPVEVSAGEKKALVTEHAELSGNSFYDPRTQQKFDFDHLRKEATNATPHSNPDQASEAARKDVETAVDAYVAAHFPAGVSSVYAKNGEIIICIEDHKYSPRNFWNGRWTSEYRVPANGGKLTGKVKILVHFYEAGNVQLHGNKDIEPVTIGAGADFGKSVAAALLKADNAYQMAVQENYRQMSQTTFKALRRQLPVTQTKLDWNKILSSSYKVGRELGGK